MEGAALCCLGPCDYDRRVYDASLQTAEESSLANTRAYFARLSPLTMNSVAGKLLDLVPRLRKKHCALASAWQITGKCKCSAGLFRLRAQTLFARYLQHELGICVG